MTTLSVTPVSRRFWSRATQALGKVWAEVISFPERLPRAPERDFTDYPRFPLF